MWKMKNERNENVAKSGTNYGHFIRKINET